MAFPFVGQIVTNILAQIKFAAFNMPDTPFDSFAKTIIMAIVALH